MRTLILTLATIMIMPFTAISQPAASEFNSTELIASAKAPIFGIGRPKYNKNRIDRKNTPAKIFRRGKSLQRKNGIGLNQGKNIQHAA